MPSVEQILVGLYNTTENFQLLSIFWHFYFAVFSVALLSGARPSTKLSGILLSLPIFSVGITAWLSFNPFNGTIFILTGALLLFFSFKLQKQAVTIAPWWTAIPGIIMIIFGWVYPHFLDTGSVLHYLHKAPTGIIPCATLSIVIGFALLLSKLNSRSFSLTLSIVGLFYGITGVTQLKVTLDWMLILGAVTLLVFSFIDIAPADSIKIQKEKKMTLMGVGPRLAFAAFPYLLLAFIVHFSDPDLMLISQNKYIVFPVIGIVFIVFGLVLWGSGARRIIKAFNENTLLTSGVFGVVRHPMYSGILVFITAGLAILLRSWPLLTVPFVASYSFWLLIKKEEELLEDKFGKQFIDYKSRVNSLIPFIHFRM